MAPRGTGNRKGKKNSWLESSFQSSHNKSMKNKTSKYKVTEEISKFEEFVNWAKENYDKLSKADQCRLVNFQYNVRDLVDFE